MQYKSIAMEILKDHPTLRTEATMLQDVERLAIQLRDNHLAWKDRLMKARPGSDEAQIASEALELAIEEVLHTSASASEADEAQAPLSLDAAMAFVRRHTPTQ